MAVRPSDVAVPRDDSAVGVARRAAVWATAALALWLVPMVGVQLGSLLEGRSVALFGPKQLVQAIGRIGRGPSQAPWWQQMPAPSATPHDPIVLLVGVALAMLAYAAVAAWAWGHIAAVTGLQVLDEQQRDLLDGARWAHRGDLDGLLTASGPIGDRVVLGRPAEPHVRGDRLVAVEAMHSALVIAPTGQGKTESLVAPAVLEWDGPVLVASIKADVYEQTAGHRATRGETRVLDPTGITDPRAVRNAFWTPLGAARDWRQARALADQMTGVGREGAQASGNESFFAEATGELLGGLFFTAAHSTVPTMRTVMEWLAAPEEAMPIIQLQLQALERDKTLPDGVRFNAPHAYNAIRLRMVGRDPRTPEAVRATAGNAIRAWADYRLADVTPDDPGVLAPDWLWSEPTRWEQPGPDRTLYVIGTDAEQATYQSLFVGAISQVYNAYARATQEGNAPPKRLLMVLDEFPQLAPIAAMDTWVTSARGLGINLMLACQNMAQLDAVWGREKAETIASGPRVRMFGPGLADQQTLSYVEKLGGQTGVVEEQASRMPYLIGLQTSRSTTTQWRPLAPENVTRAIRPFHGLVFYGNRPPFKVAWRSRVNDRELARRSSVRPFPPSGEEIDDFDTSRAERPLYVPDTYLPPTDEHAATRRDRQEGDRDDDWDSTDPSSHP